MSSSSADLPPLAATGSTSRLDRRDEPTLLEMLEGVVPLIAGTLVGAAMLPGFALCIPALAAVAVVVLVPLVAMAALASIVAATALIPYLLIRSAVESIGARRSARMRVPFPVQAADVDSRRNLRLSP